VQLQLWDTAGQERFRSITKSYYRNSVGAVLAYDICNMESYKHIPVWLLEARRHIEPHQATFLLVGCKRDLATPGSREVPRETAQALADYHGIPFLETSARTGENVEEAFSIISQTIYDKVQCGEYKLEEGWDGIKPGFLQRAGGGSGGLVEAQPTNGGCC
jgi:Ras-related protein Rab-39B